MLNIAKTSGNQPRLKFGIGAWVALLLLPLCAFAAAKPRNFEAEIKAFELADSTNPPPKQAILAVGSSSIRLWTSITNSFPGKRVLNRGFGGSHLSDVVAYADRIVLPYQPRLILLYAGDNDIAAGKTPGEIAADFSAFVKKVRGALPETRIGYIAIKPSPVRKEFLPAIRDANARIREQIINDDKLFYVDVFTPMLDADDQPNAELFNADGLHPNAQAYALWTRLISPFLENPRGVRRGQERARGH